MGEDVGCARPTGASVQGNDVGEEVQTNTEKQEVKTMQQAKVGKAAPDFQAPAYHQGEFTNIKLSDYKGKWTLVCFYPGDFTFV